MPRALRAVTVALPVAFLIALSGCAELGIVPPGSSPSSSPSSTPAPPAFALDCRAVLTTADQNVLLGSAATPVTTPPEITGFAAAAGPLALPAVGGSSCRWKHGADVLLVQALPHAGSAWTTLSEAYPNVATPGADYDGGVSLGGDCALTPTVSCRTNVLVGDAWLFVSVEAATVPGLTEAAFHDVVQRMLPAVASAVAAAPPPAAGTPVDCGAADLRAELQRAFALPAVTPLGAEPTFRIGDAVLLAPGATLCHFQPGDDGTGGYLGSLSVLPGTAAVYEQLRAAVLAQDPSARSDLMTVTGSQVPALVWSGTVEGTPFVSVDAMVGSRWVEFQSTDLDDTRSLAVVQWIAATL